MFRSPVVAIFREVFVSRYITQNVKIFIIQTILMFLCNISFTEHLREIGHNKWPKHVAGYADYNTINLHICM